MEYFSGKIKLSNAYLGKNINLLGNILCGTKQVSTKDLDKMKFKKINFTVDPLTLFTIFMFYYYVA